MKDKLDYNFFGNKLKSIRKQKHITIKEISQLIGKTTRTIGSWERNERRPSISDIRILADILGVETEKISNIENSQLQIKSLAFDRMSTEERIHELFEAKLNIEQKAFLYRLLNHFKRTMHADRELEKQLEKYKDVINSTPLAIYTKDQYRRYKLVNKYFTQLTTLTSDNIIGNNDSYVLPRELREPIKKVEDKVFENFNPVYFFRTSYMENNYKKYLSISVIPNIEENKIVSIIGFVSDITSRINAIKNYRILEHSIEQISSVLWVRYKKPVRHIVFLNSVAEKIFGTSQKELNNNPNHWKDFIYPDDQLKVKRWSDQWFKNPGDKTLPNYMIYRMVDRNGIVKEVIDKRSVFVTEDGEELECGSFNLLKNEV